MGSWEIKCCWAELAFTGPEGPGWEPFATLPFSMGGFAPRHGNELCILWRRRIDAVAGISIVVDPELPPGVVVMYSGGRPVGRIDNVHGILVPPGTPGPSPGWVDRG